MLVLNSHTSCKEGLNMQTQSQFRQPVCNAPPMKPSTNYLQYCPARCVWSVQYHPLTDTVSGRYNNKWLSSKLNFNHQPAKPRLVRTPWYNNVVQSFIHSDRAAGLVDLYLSLFHCSHAGLS